MCFIGSPFLASEDGVLGGIIVLRCCRCGEDHSSGNLQALLGTFCFITQHSLHNLVTQGLQQLFTLQLHNT